MKTRESERGAEVFIHRSQYSEAVRAELVRSFRSRAINHKFHYESYKQAQKWLALHEAHSPARTDRGCLAMYDTAFAAVAARLSRARVRVVGLGCGGGQKDVRLLELLRETNAQLAYVPCDVSLPLVLTARSAALKLMPSSAIESIVCDLAQVDDLPEVLGRRRIGRREACDTVDRGSALRERRLVTFFGMVPNFEPDEIFPRLAEAVRRGDWLLMSANLVPGMTSGGTDVAGDGQAMRRILPQYDNELTRDWLMTLLYDVGLEKRDGRLDFSIEQKGGLTPLSRFVARYHFGRSCQVRFGGTTIPFKRGDALRLFFSYRYTVCAVAQLLSCFGLRVVQKWVAPSGEEGVFLVRR